MERPGPRIKTEPTVLSSTPPFSAVPSQPHQSRKDPGTEMLMVPHKYSFRFLTVLSWPKVTGIGTETFPDPF